MQIKYRWSEAKFINLALYDFELGPNSWRGKATLWLVVFTLGGLLAINLAHRGFSYSVWDLVIVAAGLCWYALRGTLMVRMFKRSFRRSGMDGKSIEYQLDEEQVKAQAEGHPEQLINWAQIKLVIRTPQGFLMYPGPGWLDSSGLEDAYNIEELAALLQRKVANYVDKSKYNLKIKE